MVTNMVVTIEELRNGYKIDDITKRIDMMDDKALEPIRIITIETLPKDCAVLASEDDLVTIKNINKENIMSNEKKEPKFEMLSVEEQNKRIFTGENGKKYTRKKLVEMHPFCDELAHWTTGPQNGSVFQVGSFTEAGKKYTYNAPKED